MIRIIYLDIDGTLRDEEKGVPKSAVQALLKCRESGIQIVVCTGRNPGSIQDDVWALNPDGVISGGGCYISFQGKRLRERYFSEGLLKDTVSMAQELSLSLAMETEQHIYMDDEASRFYQEDFQHKICGCSKNRSGEVFTQNKISYEANLNQLWESAEKIHKACIFGKRHDIDQVEKKLAQAAEPVQKKEWNGRWYLELLPKGCQKGEAVTWLNSWLGISRSDSMSFGDGENDIAMLKATGAAVAMGDSSPLVRRYASYVCEPAAEDGIYKELIRQGIIGTIYGERSS